MLQLRTSVNLIVVVAMTLAADANAGVYKCQDANGGITYSQTPCPKAEKTLKVTESATNQNSESLDCTLAHRFALESARFMKTGSGSAEVFDYYGGLGSLSKGAVGVINYVFSFRTNEDVSSERVASLALAKCQSRAFADISCDELPDRFTARQKSCNDNDVALHPEDYELNSQPMSLQPQTPVRPTPETSSVVKTREAKARAEEQRKQCREKYREQIERIDAQMRSGYSASRGDLLRERRRNFREQMAAC